MNPKYKGPLIAMATTVAVMILIYGLRFLSRGTEDVALPAPAAGASSVAAASPEKAKKVRKGALSMPQSSDEELRDSVAASAATGEAPASPSLLAHSDRLIMWRETQIVPDGTIAASGTPGRPAVAPVVRPIGGKPHRHRRGRGHYEHGNGLGLGHVKHHDDAEAPRPRLRGETDKCALVSRVSGLSIEEVQAMRESGLGWGQIAREVKAGLRDVRRADRGGNAGLKTAGVRRRSSHGIHARVETIAARTAFAMKAKDASRSRGPKRRVHHD